jgi:hypothetical protein
MNSRPAKTYQVGGNTETKALANESANLKSRNLFDFRQLCITTLYCHFELLLRNLISRLEKKNSNNILAMAFFYILTGFFLNPISHGQGQI